MATPRSHRCILGSLALLLTVAVASLTACADDPSSSAGSAAPGPAATLSPTTATTARLAATPEIAATVVSVTDGDTIVVRTAAGSTERVRLIGIDTPETRDPRRPVECFGREASAATAALVPPGTTVLLELDFETRDRYDRLLAYVRTADGIFVNARLVEHGWAVPYRYPPNVRYADLFTRLGAEARAADAGLWRACGGADTPASS